MTIASSFSVLGSFVRERAAGENLEQAKQVIFQPMPELQGSGPFRQGRFWSFWGRGFGGGFNLNHRRGKVEIAISLTFELDEINAQPHSRGGAIEGVAITNDPAQKGRYLRKLFPDNWERKITTECPPIVDRPDPESNQPGTPVEYLSVPVDSAGGSGGWWAELGPPGENRSAYQYRVAGFDDVGGGPVIHPHIGGPQAVRSFLRKALECPLSYGSRSRCTTRTRSTRRLCETA